MARSDFEQFQASRPFYLFELKNGRLQETYPPSIFYLYISPAVGLIEILLMESITSWNKAIHWPKDEGYSLYKNRCVAESADFSSSDHFPKTTKKWSLFVEGSWAKNLTVTSFWMTGLVLLVLVLVSVIVIVIVIVIICHYSRVLFAQVNDTDLVTVSGSVIVCNCVGEWILLLYIYIYIQI